MSSTQPSLSGASPGVTKLFAAGERNGSMYAVGDCPSPTRLPISRPKILATPTCERTASSHAAPSFSA
eukprot:scaffold29387_cov54-Phaeocystis_antarctica.AAC.2